MIVVTFRIVAMTKALKEIRIINKAPLQLKAQTGDTCTS